MVVQLYFFFFKQKTAYEIGLGIPAEPLFRSLEAVKKPPPNNLDMAPPARAEAIPPAIAPNINHRSEERFSRNAETDLVCRLLLEKKKTIKKLLTPENEARSAEQRMTRTARIRL